MVGAMSCSLFLRVKAAWLSAQPVVPRRIGGAQRRAGAAGSSSIMLPWDDEKVSQSRAACTMSS